jgi:ParB-like chromosome segregation protein Spo0J
MEQIPIGSVRPHPENPRRGNVAAIAESLRVNGQFKPILVHRPTRHILAGTHTWKAAKQLGWPTIAAVFSDADAPTAKRIMLADNRAADGGWTDEAAAFDILATLPDLEGTGYTLEDMNLPPLQDPELPPATTPSENHDTPDDDTPPPEPPGQRFEIGTAKGTVTDAEYERWRQTFPKAPAAAAEQLLHLLGLGVQPAPQPAATAGETTIVPISSLEEYPGNPRQGDIGLIATLLKHHGQYRPIVANRRNRRILAGNSTTAAARHLGWDRIWVAWVDADDDAEKRIVLADNRTSDLSSYDMDALGRALAGTGPDTIAETGFSLSDLDDILNGRPIRETTRTGQAWIRVGKVTARTTHAALNTLNLTPGQELLEAAFILGLDPQQIKTGTNQT